MDAKQLQELAERLLLGEYTTNDLHDAARCAAAWAKVERAMQASRQGVEIFGYKGRTLPWAYMPSDLLTARYSGSTAIAAVEAAPEVKP